MSTTTAAFDVDELMRAAFDVARDPTSPEYKAGARATLEHRIHQRPARCPHNLGTAQADAWFAGVDEGRAIWIRIRPAVAA